MITQPNLTVVYLLYIFSPFLYLRIRNTPALSSPTPHSDKHAHGELISRVQADWNLIMTVLAVCSFEW